MAGFSKPDYGTPGEVVRKLMWCDLPGVSKIGWDSVEISDLATAHVSRAWECRRLRASAFAVLLSQSG